MENEFSTSDMGPNGHATSMASAPKVPSAVERTGVSREIHSFLTDIEDLIKSATSLTGEDLARAKANLNARIASARQSVDAMGVKIADGARSTARFTDGYVHDRPWQAVGIGAAAGLLIGLILARRRS